MTALSFVLAGAALTAILAASQPSAPTQVDAIVLGVTDGDTITVDATIWLDQHVVTAVRLRGIDAPEMRGRCRQEIVLARAARDALAAMAAGQGVTLTEIERDKYGRVLARVTLENSLDVGAVLVDRGLARPYNGEKRGGWC